MVDYINQIALYVILNRPTSVYKDLAQINDVDAQIYGRISRAVFKPKYSEILYDILGLFWFPDLDHSVLALIVIGYFHIDLFRVWVVLVIFISRNQRFSQSGVHEVTDISPDTNPYHRYTLLHTT